MDVEALQRRVASSRDGMIVREGDIVTHYDTDKAFRVDRVYPFLGDAWDVDSNEIDVTELARAHAKVRQACDGRGRGGRRRLLPRVRSGGEGGLGAVERGVH